MLIKIPHSLWSACSPDLGQLWEAELLKVEIDLSMPLPRFLPCYLKLEAPLRSTTYSSRTPQQGVGERIHSGMGERGNTGVGERANLGVCD